MSAVMLASHNRKKKKKIIGRKTIIMVRVAASVRVCVVSVYVCSARVWLWLLRLQPPPLTSVSGPAAPSLPGQWNQPGATTKSHDRVKVAWNKHLH